MKDLAVAEVVLCGEFSVVNVGLGRASAGGKVLYPINAGTR